MLLRNMLRRQKLCRLSELLFPQQQCRLKSGRGHCPRMAKESSGEILSEVVVRRSWLVTDGWQGARIWEIQPHVEVDSVGVFVLHFLHVLVCVCLFVSTAIMRGEEITHYTNQRHTRLEYLLVESLLIVCVNQLRPTMFHCLFLCCLTLSCIPNRWSSCT